MHHFVQEGGDSLKSLSSVQPPGAKTNKEDIKTCKQRGKEAGSPWSFPVILLQGQWRHSRPLDKACPIVTLSLATFLLP